MTSNIGQMEVKVEMEDNVEEVAFYEESKQFYKLPEHEQHLPAILNSERATGPTYHTLCKCVLNNVLDVYAAGAALFEGYSTNPNCVSTDVEQFVEKFADMIFSSKIPASLNISDPNLPVILSLGNMVASSVSLANTRSASTSNTDINSEFDKLTGAAFNVKNEFFYPKDAPFNGKKITCDGFPYSDKVTHILLKKYLFILLGRACVNATDIQTTTWLLPDDKYSKGRNPTPFPRALYNDLQKFFLEFFNINDPELDVLQFQEEFRNIPSLKCYDDMASKKKLFKELAAARSAFLKTIFRAQLKEALTELKNSTYTPPEAGMSHGVFEYRKRGKKRELLSAD